MGYIKSLTMNRDAKLKVEIAPIQPKTDSIWSSSLSISIDLVFVNKLLKIEITKEDYINPVL